MGLSTLNNFVIVVILDLACVAGAWKYSGRKRERARARETREG